MARNFANASTETITVDSTPVTAAPFTMACWARCTQITARDVAFNIVDKDATTQEFTLMFSGDVSGDPITFRARNAGTTVLTVTSAGYSADTWHHLCAVETAVDSHAVFLDGANKGTSTTSVTPSGVDRVAFGRYAGSTPSNFLNGDIAEAAIWSVALGDAEVASLARGFSPLLIRPQSLELYAPLMGNNAPEMDIVGGLSLTVANTTKADHPRVFMPPAPNAMTWTVAAAATVVKDMIGSGMIAFAR
jgi:hypothetical protein